MEQLDKYGFDHPTNTIVSGPSGSGKSQILAQILGCADYIFDPSPVKRILFYREDQTIYDQWYESGLITHKQKGMPERDELMSLISENKDGGGSLVFFDDCASFIEENKEDFNYYFTVASHHYKTSFFLVLHSLFSPALRILSLNTHRFILTQSPRDVGQVRTLASQSFPGRTQFVVDAYEDSTDREFGFLIMDFSPRCDKRLRVVGNIFSKEPISVYQCKKVGKSHSDKMEKAFKKQALIPWSDYLNLQEKQAKNGTLCNHQSCRQGDQCTSPSIRNVYSVISPTDSSDRGIHNNNNSKQQSSKEEPVEQAAGPPSQLHAVTQSPGGGRPIVQSPVEAFAKPSDSAEQTSALSTPLGAKESVMVELKQKLARRDQRNKVESMNTQVSRPIGSRPNPQLGVRDMMMVELKQRLASRDQINQGVVVGARTDLTNDSNSHHQQSAGEGFHTPLESHTASPNLPLEAMHPNSGAVYQYSPPSQSVNETSPMTLAVASNFTPSIPSIDYTSPPIIRALENESTPVTASENRATSAPDSAYPLSLLRDPDVQPNPASFPPSSQDKRLKKKKLKRTIFKPSPPIESRDQPSEKTKASKRKGTHLSKPRLSLPRKYMKINRGEKRENVNEGKRAKKVLKVRAPPLESTDYDIWQL